INLKIYFTAQIDCAVAVLFCDGIMKSKINSEANDMEITNSPFRGPGGKISNTELTNLGINTPELLALFSRVANGLLKNKVMDRLHILANIEALIEDPMPYAIKKGGKFKNLAE